MKPIATMALLLFCSTVAVAQQNPTYIYMYDANAIPGLSYNTDIDGITLPILQYPTDLCPATCAAAPTYSWPDTGTPSFATWTGASCGLSLRGVPTACTVNLNFKSVTNGGNNTWAPQYIFTQTWANYAAQPWQASHTYPIGYTITCGYSSPVACSTHYYQLLSTGLNGGVCQSGPSNPGSTMWSTSSGNTTDGSCTWKDRGTNAPLQDVVFDGDYPGGLAWQQSTNYQPNAIISAVQPNGHYYSEAFVSLIDCPTSVTGQCTSGTSVSPWNTGSTPTCDNTCTWNDLGESIALNSASATSSDSLQQIASGMPAVWETPFAYSQQLFYESALTHYASVSRASQIRYIRTGVGVGEEATIAGAQSFEHLLTLVGSLNDAQLKGIWTNQALQIYATNVTTIQGLSPQPSWVMMALINCGTGLSTSPGVDCTWADVEAQGALAEAPYYGGYGTQGLQTTDLFLIGNVAQCRIPFQGKSCCSDNWCETRYYMTGKLPYIELQELCSSYFASGTSVICIYDPNNPNASLSEVLALATQHGTNVIELGIPEFACAYGSSCPSGTYPGAATANSNAIQNAASGMPSATTTILGTAGLLDGVGDIF